MKSYAFIFLVNVLICRYKNASFMVHNACASIRKAFSKIYIEMQSFRMHAVNKWLLLKTDKIQYVHISKQINSTLV